MEPPNSMCKSLHNSNSGIHVCHYCGKSFARRSYLSCHMIAHRSPPLECDACHCQFGRVDSFRRHRCPAANAAASSSESLSTGTVRPRHTCPSCRQTYSRRETLLQHIVRHHRDLLDESSGRQKAIKAHPCSVCRRVFASALSLHNHEVLIHGSMAQADSVGFLCSSCGCQFASQLNADRHLCRNETQQQGPEDESVLSQQHQTTLKGPTVQSNVCHAVESNVDDEPTSPQQTVAETIVPVVKRFTCQFCGRIFSGNGWLCRHIAAAHADEALILQSYNDISSTADQSASKLKANSGHVCPVCGKSLSSVGNLNKHLLIHGPRQETCPECGRQFHQCATLRQHVQHVHAAPGSFAVECPTCGTRMRSRNSLYSHVARFHAESSSSILPRHVCEVCGRAFHQRGNLRKHERTHRDDAVYFCPECPCQLRTAQRLQRHQTWHKHGAKFTCADCRRCFVLPSDLRRHVAYRHSTTKKTYRCCYCGVCCKHYQTMRRHLQRRHADQVIWQTTDVRNFIEALSIHTMKQLSSRSNQDLAASSSCSGDVQDIQETEIPLTVGAENEAELESYPPAFLFVDSDCPENRTG